MQYSPEELKEHLGKVVDTINGARRQVHDDLANTSKLCLERLASDAFTDLCADLVVAAKNTSLQNHPGYDCALGVVGASANSQYQLSALEEIAEVLHSSDRSLVGARYGFEAKAKSIGTNGFDLRPNHMRPFDKATAGFMLASSYAPLHDLNFVVRHIGAIGNFLEDLEKTRDRMPDWNDSPLKGWFKDIADGHHLEFGRKHPDMAKILRLLNDGTELVSISDCVEATRGVFEGLVNSDFRSNPDLFLKNLDVLDDHKSFYEVGFQTVFLELNQQQSFMDFGFRQHDDQGKSNFSMNLAELAKRTESRLPDSRIMLASFLLGGSVTDSLITKDRAQGDPFWLENAILDRARHPASLALPDSSLRIVMEALLKSRTDAEAKAFWEKRPERSLLHQRVHGGDGLSR